MWRPILEGALADRAWAAVRAIAHDLADEQRRASDRALFWSYAATALNDEVSAARRDAALDGMADEIAREQTTLFLHGGLLEVAWIASHTLEGVDEYLADVDEQVVSVLELRKPWPGHYDLVGGLAGMGVYFLERGDSPVALAGLDMIIEQLRASAEQDELGARWFSAREHIPLNQVSLAPNGYYNCGIAHGTPGVVGFLARCKRPWAAELRDAAARWVAAQYAGFYPSWIADGKPAGSRVAWCYGDPGVVLALWSAARAAGTSTQEIEARAIATLSTPLASSGVDDAMLCHGAGGLAHISNRFFQATGNPRFAELALRWFEHALEFRGAHGIGGFGMYLRETQTMAVRPDFLDGSIGVGLALIAGLVPLEPEWDRLLLADLA